MNPIERALAELRAITTVDETDPEPTAETPACCNGQRTGYQWHRRNKIPACPQSAAAAAAYMREYYDRSGRYTGRRQRAAAARRSA